MTKLVEYIKILIIIMIAQTNKQKKKNIIEKTIKPAMKK